LSDMVNREAQRDSRFFFLVSTYIKAEACELAVSPTKFLYALKNQVEDIVRLVAMLDDLEARTSARAGQHSPAPTPQATSPVPTQARPLTSEEGTQFDSLIAGLIPCRSQDPELWFAEQATQIAQAKALCGTCPIADACLTGALDRAEPWGVWGGEVLVDGAIVAPMRGRGRPRKQDAA